MIPFPFQTGQLGLRKTPSFAGGDPNFANVSLLLHLDGADGSTVFTDNSPSPKTLTLFGNAQIDTAQSKFGGASGLFDGVGDYATVPDSADFDFGSGDWTIEMFIRPGGLNTNGIISKRADGTFFSPFYAYFTGTGAVGLLCSANGSSWAVNIISTAAAVGTGVWAHLAFVRSGNVFTVYVDGVSRAATTQSITLMSNSTAVALAAVAADGSTPFNGHLDEVRITKGIARYTGAFTPPASAFPNS